MQGKSKLTKKAAPRRRWPALAAAVVVLTAVLIASWIHIHEPRADAAPQNEPDRAAATPEKPENPPEAVKAPAQAAAPSSEAPPAPAERARVKVLGAYPHDVHAFTQGLLWYKGTLFESTGRYGRSELRQVDLETGTVMRRTALPSRFFGEGLARVGDRLVQLTWQEETAFFWDLATFEAVGEKSYPGEGWGLCYDGSRLVMSDGSDRLRFLDPKTLAEQGGIRVTLDGEPLRKLNELECVGDEIWANVWTTEALVRIDPRSGRVRSVVDASGLLAATERLGTDVLNGIAYRPDTRTFLITGKYWPKLFEVEIVPVIPGA